MTGALRPGRYVHSERRGCIYDFSCCNLCGTGWGGRNATGACAVTTCLACGTPQCMANGLGRGQCGVCLIGLLRGWSGADRPCGYKNCGKRAVAAAPRVGYCCADHARTCVTDQKPVRRTVADIIARAVAWRAEKWVWLGDEPEPRAAIVGGAL